MRASQGTHGRNPAESVTESIDPYREVIVRAFPELRHEPLRLHHLGWDSLAIEVADHIFKFPRKAEAEQALRREVRILAAIRPHVDVRVPDLELIDGPRPFSRHRKIPGEHLLGEQYEKLPGLARERLAGELAGLYPQLHALEVETMRDVGAVPIQPFRPLHEIVAKGLPPAEFRSLCEATIGAYGKLSPDPLGTTFGFFDGHGWNMAFDHVGQRLNGVYDFADSGFGPVHQDFIYSSFISPELTRMVVERYARLTGRDMDHERIPILGGMLRRSELTELADDRNRVGMMRDSLVAWAKQVEGFG